MSAGVGRIPSGLALIIPATSFEDCLDWLRIAGENGYQEVQVNLAWNPITDAQLAQLKETLSKFKLTCRTVGCYNDLLQIDSYHFFRTSGVELKKIIAWMPSIGARNVVAWSGSYDDDLLATHPKNTTPEALALLTSHVKALQGALAASGARLLIEPWHTHVLGDEVAMASFFSQFPGTVGCIFDFPNFLKFADWGKRNERLQSMLRHLSKHTGTVHLKDIRFTDGKLSLPFPGGGDLDYPYVLSQLKSLWGTVPFVGEHMTKDEVAPVTKFLLASLKKAGLT